MMMIPNNISITLWLPIYLGRERERGALYSPNDLTPCCAVYDGVVVVAVLCLMKTDVE